MPVVTINDLILLGGTGVDAGSLGSVFSYDANPDDSDLVDVLNGLEFTLPDPSYGQTIPLGSTVEIGGVTYTLTDAYELWTRYTKIDPDTGEEFTQDGSSFALTLTDPDGNEIFFISPADAFNEFDPWLSGDILSIEVLTEPYQTDSIQPGADGENKLAEDKDVSVPCFAAGTLIDTSEGLKPVEDIRPGDMVLTRDNGYMPVEWVGARVVDTAELGLRPEFAAIVFKQGALGANLPEQDLRVSPSHRMLIAGQRPDMIFGEREVLVPAAHMLGMPGVERDSGPVTYVHIMFENHQIIRGNGAWSESFQPLADTLDGLGEEQRAELLALFPELSRSRGATAYGAARMSLKRHESQILFTA